METVNVSRGFATVSQDSWGPTALEVNDCASPIGEKLLLLLAKKTLTTTKTVHILHVFSCSVEVNCAPQSVKNN